MVNNLAFVVFSQDAVTPGGQASVPAVHSDAAGGGRGPQLGGQRWVNMHPHGRTGQRRGLSGGSPAVE
jgi:hypothetical protein